MDQHTGSATSKIGILDLSGDPFTGDLIDKLPQIDLVVLDAHKIDTYPYYRVILDRASYLYSYLREMLKDMALRGCYVINNPFTASLNNKIVDVQICHRLKIPTPRTFVLPDLSFSEEFPVPVTEVPWEKLASELSLPFVLKPYNGYGWDDVYIINSQDEFKSHYHISSSRRIFIAQQLIQYSQYYRVFCIGKTELLFTQWVPKPFGEGEYNVFNHSISDSTFKDISQMTVNLNTALDLDINVIEWCLDRSGTPYLIDAYNEVPDVPADKLPQESYYWIVNQVAELILDKVRNPGKMNKNPLQ